MPSNSHRIYWTRDEAGSVTTWTMQYNAWPGREWYSIRSGDVVPFPGQRISAETSIHQMDDGTYMARTVRVNTRGPNYRRTERGLDWRGAQWQCDHWQLLHERYALGRLAVRSTDDGWTYDPRCDHCGELSSHVGLEWDDTENMHHSCVVAYRAANPVTPPFTMHADEEVTPRCDYCNATEEDSPMMEWNGDEGMHQECIAEMNNTIARALGEVPMPEPGRPRLNALVPDAHDGWFV